MKSRASLLSVAAMLAIGAGCLGGLLFITNSSRSPQAFTASFPLHEGSTEKVFLTVTKNAQKRWMEDGTGLMGAQFDGVIDNRSQSDIRDWRVTIEIPKGCRIDSSWNGFYTISDDRITILPPADYNLIVKPNTSITFGMIFYAPPDFEVKNCSISYRQMRDYHESPVFWILIFALFGIIVALISYAVFMVRLSQLKKKQEQDRHFIEQTLKLFAKTIEAKDPYTRGHSERVSIYSKEIAGRIGLSAEEQQRIYYAAILHDIGKIGVPDSILNKPGRLDESEMQIMRQHATIGSDILEGFDSVPGIAQIVRHHHERMDGKGYPDGLAGTAIPLASRILCAADCFDAMTSDRCYRSRLPMDLVIEHLKSASGPQLDPALVGILLKMIDEGSAPINGTQSKV